MSNKNIGFWICTVFTIGIAQIGGNWEAYSAGAFVILALGDR